MSISLKTHKMLWGSFGNRCAFPSCKKILIEGQTDTDQESLIGEESHIVAKQLKGPRGKSSLTSSQRDNYENLLLLCKNHHKIIDDQPNKYTVEFLLHMKKEHLEWVNKNLTVDKNKQQDDEIYSAFIDEWAKLANINNWSSWASDILQNGLPKIKIRQYKNLEKLNKFIFSRVWPGRYPELKFAFVNFENILSDFINVFSKYKIKIAYKDLYYWTEKIYERLNRWDPEAHSRLLQKFNYHVALVQDLLCELTRAGNFLCDQIRKDISPSFRIKEGVLLVISGPYMDLKYKTHRLMYISNNISDCIYPGLREFMEVRNKRNIFFGDGVREDYFHHLF